MSEPARSAPPNSLDERGPPTGAIVSLVGKGLTARQILALFPSLTPERIRAALLTAADVVQDQDRSLLPTRDVATLLAAAREHAGLDEEEAMALAVEETRAARRERKTQQ